MSNIQLVIEERARNIGNFMVGRLIPFREKRMVGPFAFIDHLRHTEMQSGDNMDVPPHPHIGLSTLTYLFEGSIMHRDSLGTVQEIQPGEVNWMTAGKGIVHSERTPDRLRNVQKRLHGLQIWVALPKDQETVDPSFAHFEEKDIPGWVDGPLQFKLIAGEVLGHQSPVPVFSPLYLIEIHSTEEHVVRLGDALFGESALYILNGGIRSEGHHYEPGHILVARESRLCEFEMERDTTVFIFGGEPFPEERIIDWNFIASERRLIDEARNNWKKQTFPRVPGETDYVPLPEPVPGWKS